MLINYWDMYQAKSSLEGSVHKFEVNVRPDRKELQEGVNRIKLVKDAMSNNGPFDHGDESLTA